MVSGGSLGLPEKPAHWQVFLAHTCTCQHLVEGGSGQQSFATSSDIRRLPSASHNVPSCRDQSKHALGVCISPAAVEHFTLLQVVCCWCCMPCSRCPAPCHQQADKSQDDLHTAESWDALICMLQQIHNLEVNQSPPLISCQ